MRRYYKMKKRNKTAFIIFPYQGLEFNICTLIETIYEDDFDYTFIPNYDIIKLIPKNAGFEGIQGLDLKLQEKIYRRNGIPVFISERTMPKNRERLMDYLESIGLNYYDPLEILYKNKEKYCGDALLVKKSTNKMIVDVDYDNVTNLYQTVKRIMYNIAFNNDVLINSESIDKEQMFKNLYPVYLNLYLKKKKEQLKATRERISYKGRPRININDNDYLQIYNAYKNKELSMNDALDILGISRSTFIRKQKEFQK